MKEPMASPVAEPRRKPAAAPACPLGAAMERAVLALGRGFGAGGPGDGEGLYERLLRRVFREVLRAVASDRGLDWVGGDLPVSERICAQGNSAWGGDGLGDWAGLLAAEASGWMRQFDVRDLGAAHEYLLELSPGVDSDGRFTLVRRAGHARKTSGSYYTPAALVDHILDRALEPVIEEAWDRGGADAVLSIKVCDPACGSGNFLLPAVRRIARRLVAGGGCDEPAALAQAAARCVFGMDKNPLAADLCRAGMWLEFSSPGSPAGAPPEHIRVGDALAAEWPSLFPGVFAAGGFDAVVGNPPFLNQLGSATAATRADAAALKRCFPGIVGPYTDPAALFLVLGTRVARPGGRIAMVLPQSVLSARDAGAARREVLSRGVPESLWVAGEHIFDALVLVCAPCVRVGGSRRGTLARSAGAGFRGVPDLPLDADGLMGEENWAPLAAAAMGIPELTIRASGTLGDLATATADFRDQFYGLRGFIIEDDDLGDRDPAAFPPLVTTGLIDPAACLWGRVPTRVDGQRWKAPRVDLRQLEAAGELGPWARSRLIPKILLATQTRVLEAAVDEEGSWIPAVPLITVVPRDAGMIWRIAAALVSPPLTVWAAQRYGIGGLSAGSIKLSARQAVGLPIPESIGPWDEAAGLLRRSGAVGDAERAVLVLEAASLMCIAYGLDPADAELAIRWWQGLYLRSTCRARLTSNCRGGSFPP